MIKRLFSALKSDIYFQHKHGFYYVYLILSAIYIFIIGFLNVQAIKYVLPVVIFLDPSVLGMFFIGGILLLEKEQGIMMQLFVTPLQSIEYIISKVISLGLISLLAGVLITLLCFHEPIRWDMLIFGILLTSVFFTLVGMLVARHAKSVNDYMIRIVPYLAVAMLICLVLIPNPWISESTVTYLTLLPSIGGLNLILSAFWEFDSLSIFFSYASLVICDVFLTIYAAHVFSKKIILEEE